MQFLSLPWLLGSVWVAGLIDRALCVLTWLLPSSGLRQMPGGTQSFYLGACNGGADPLEGQMDNVAILNAELTTEDMAQVYNHPNGWGSWLGGRCLQLSLARNLVSPSLSPCAPFRRRLPQQQARAWPAAVLRSG